MPFLAPPVMAVTLQLFLAVVAKAALQLRAFAFGHVHG